MLARCGNLRFSLNININLHYDLGKIQNGFVQFNQVWSLVTPNQIKYSKLILQS